MKPNSSKLTTGLSLLCGIALSLTAWMPAYSRQPLQQDSRQDSPQYCKLATLDRVNVYATSLTVDGTQISYLDFRNKSYRGGESFGILLPNEVEKFCQEADSLIKENPNESRISVNIRDFSLSLRPEALAYLTRMLKQSLDTAGKLKPTESLSQIDAAFYSEAEKDYFIELDRNKAIQRTASGLRYSIEIPSAESAANSATANRKEPPTESNNAVIAYRGTHTNGELFDENDNADFPVYTLIDGLKEGLSLMTEGSKYRFYIPSNLAYGATGYYDIIAPGEPLIFDVTLRGVR